MRVFSRESRLYKRVRPSVRPWVRGSVRPWVRQVFFLDGQNCAKSSLKRPKEFQNGEAGSDKTTLDLFCVYELVREETNVAIFNRERKKIWVT